MKSKREIYNNTVELIEKQDKANYLAYYKVFLENSSRNNISQEKNSNWSSNNTNCSNNTA